MMDKVDDASAFVEAAPAIDLDDCPGGSTLSTLGRGDGRIRALTRSDERLLAGEPQPLKILVPVLIDA